MILIDSSLWIEALIDPRRVPEVSSRTGEFVTCGPVLQEVLQGLDPNKPASGVFSDYFLALPRISDPVPSGLFLKAAEIYVHGRRRGISIRSGADCLIAAIAIENEIELWHKDRDFVALSSYTRLREVSK